MPSRGLRNVRNAECGMRSEAIEAVGADGVCAPRRIRLARRSLRPRDFRRQSIAAKSRPLLESIEGTATDDWPPSPPLQSLSIETLPDGRRVALLVGMAGRSHWSASIEAVASAPSLSSTSPAATRSSQTSSAAAIDDYRKSSDVAIAVDEELVRSHDRRCRRD